MCRKEGDDREQIWNPRGCPAAWHVSRILLPNCGQPHHRSRQYRHHLACCFLFPCGCGLASSFLITEQSKGHRLPWTQARLEIAWGSTGRLVPLIAKWNEISFLSMLWVWQSSTLSWNLPGLNAEYMPCVCLPNLFYKVIYFCFLFSFFFPLFLFSTRKKHHLPMLHFGLQEKETWLSSSCCWTVGE